MTIFTKIAQWADNHNPKWLALVRLFLGAAILLRGVLFLDNAKELNQSISSYDHITPEWASLQYGTRDYYWYCTTSYYW